MSPSSQSVQPDPKNDSQTKSLASPPPDWDKVLFGVSCARCGQDLHGLTEPVCPVCRLEFDWAAAVPIEQLTCASCDYHLYGLTETRCPECGTPFTWESALANYHRNKNPLFEYQWRHHPIKSFFGTWLRTLRPKKFWQSVVIHDPPKVRSLILGVLVGCVLITIYITLLEGFCQWFWQSRQWVRTGLRSGEYVMRYDLGKFPWNLYQAITSPATYVFLKPLLIWITTSFVALLVFPQSMRLCKVRISQVVRVWAYTILPIVPISCTISYGISYGLAFWGYWSSMFDAIEALAVIAFVVYSLYIGYRNYLKMPHSAAIAIASQLIAILLAGIFELLLSSNLPSTLFYQLLKSLHFV